jgi:hypothetical protein
MTMLTAALEPPHPCGGDFRRVERDAGRISGPRCSPGYSRIAAVWRHPGASSRAAFVSGSRKPGQTAVRWVEQTLERIRRAMELMGPVGTTGRPLKGPPMEWRLALRILEKALA